MKLEQSRVIKFLQINDWEQYPESDEFMSFRKDGVFSIDVNDKEIIILDDTGDIEHLPLNLYAIIGYLLDKRQLSINYKKYNAYNSEEEIII